jgi:hypothetical protein
MSEMGSKPENLKVSINFPVYPPKRTFLCTSIDLFGWHRRLDHQYPQREALLAGPEYQCGGLGASVAASLTVFCSYTSVVISGGSQAGRAGVCITRWSSEFRLLAAAIVALSCLGRDAHAFTLCENCPDLFAASIAQRTTQAEPRAQSTRVHDRIVSRRLQRKLDVPPRPPLARRTALTAFAAVPISGGTIGANVSVTIADPVPLAPDAAMPATPALRIDHLFNIMAAGPSDRPEEVAVLRADVLSQFHMPQASPSPDDRSSFFVPTAIAFGSGLLLIGGILGSARLHAFSVPPPPGRRSDRAMFLIGRTPQSMNGNPLADPIGSPGVTEPATVFAEVARRNARRRAMSPGRGETAPIPSVAAVTPDLLLVAAAGHVTDSHGGPPQLRHQLREAPAGAR